MAYVEENGIEDYMFDSEDIPIPGKIIRSLLK